VIFFKIKLSQLLEMDFQAANASQQTHSSSRRSTVLQELKSNFDKANRGKGRGLTLGGDV
jgi:hypothetical protein